MPAILKMKTKAQIKSKKSRIFSPRKAQKAFQGPEIQKISWPLKSLKAQIKIQEMAFVLLAIVLLAIIAFVFFMRFQSGNIANAAEEAKQKTAISMLDKVASLEELSCSQGEICIDEDKAAISKTKNLGDLFQGIKKVEVKKLYPSEESIVIYQSGQGNQSYSTFISLCKQEKVGYSFEWHCGMAVLELWI